jgi:hypothetical protein
VFDGSGGRPLGPGQFAAWFNGGPLDHRRPGIRIVMPQPEEQIGPGNLVCRLVAEWSNQSTDEVLTRCGPGGTPRLFRVGPWLAERTADVAVRRSRRALRADHEAPPEPIEPRPSHAFLTRAMLARIEGRPPPRVPPRDLPPPPDEGILVRNDGPCRNVVVVNGVPIGYVDAGATGHFRAVMAGVYRIGAMRPLGWVTLGADPVVVPGALRLPR